MNHFERIGAATRDDMMAVIRDHYRVCGGSLPVREIGRRVGLHSSSTAMRHLHRLVSEGLVRRVDGGHYVPVTDGTCPLCGKPS